MAFDRTELNEMKERWEAANIACEEAGDWRSLADFYADDATYGWNYGPKKDFMAVGIDEIRDLALDQEMQGLEGWTYPYQWWVIDDQTGDMIGFWKQVFDKKRSDGTNYGITEGLGGSWFRYAGNFKFAWQRDFFDYGNVAEAYLEIFAAKIAGEGMLKRMEVATGNQPGWYPLGKAPSKMWNI